MYDQSDPIMTYAGKLSVEPRGYWFTAGGQKGSFGYYPHLRDAQDFPVYPDTQIHGDLKMAARWLVALGAVKSDLVTDLFGSGGGNELKYSTPSKVFIGDLALDERSREEWENNEGHFEVKPRIKIRDAVRTVEEHFLVDLEMAKLEGLALESPIYLTVPETKLKEAEDLIREAVTLLSGFGAFRSRGYGRGKITVGEFTRLEQENTKSGSRDLTSKHRFALTALVNVRNKPVDPGNAQVISTSLALSTGQIKGWLARAYHDAHSQWPTPAQMAGIELSPLYPSPGPDILAWPSPMSTLTDKDSTIKDTWGEKRDDNEQHENFFSGKAKPLGSGYTVTEDGRAWPVVCSRRIRNNTEDNFATTENGLFVQEYLPARTVFTGTISLKGAEDEFAENILKLLTAATPALNGALFKPTLGTICPVFGAKDGKPELLDRPRPFRRELMQNDNSINIATIRGYNRVLKRPRRGRVVILPGSTLISGATEGNKPWQGFVEKELSIENPSTPDTDSEQKKALFKKYPITLTPGQRKLSRSQAGILRTMLHPALTIEVLQSELDHRIEKYMGKEKFAEIRQLLEAVRAILVDKKKDGGLSNMREALRGVIKQLALARWDEKKKKTNGKGKREE